MNGWIRLNEEGSTAIKYVQTTIPLNVSNEMTVCLSSLLYISDIWAYLNVTAVITLPPNSEKMKIFSNFLAENVSKMSNVSSALG